MRESRESVPRLVKGSMRNYANYQSRSKITDNHGIASLIAGVSGSNKNIDRQYTDLLNNFDSNKPESPSELYALPISTTRSQVNLLPKRRIEKRAMSIATMLKEAQIESKLGNSRGRVSSLLDTNSTTSRQRLGVLSKEGRQNRM